MKLDDIMNLWEKDAKVDVTELGRESAHVPYLHHKYFKIYTQEALILKGYEYERKVLFKQKHQYYTGTIDEETLKEKGWEPNPMRILKQDLPVYLESDEDLQTIEKKIDIQKQKIDFLESVIKTVMNRGYLIKNVIEWERFKAGG